MATQPDEYVSRDHTRLKQRDKRIWTIGDIPIPGTSIPAMVSGGIGFVLAVMVTMVLTKLPVLSSISALLYAADIGFAVGFAFWWSRYRPDDMEAAQWVMVIGDWWRQPKLITGMDADDEPDIITYTVILWEPGAEWRHERDAALETYRTTLEVPDVMAAAPSSTIHSSHPTPTRAGHHEPAPA